MSKFKVLFIYPNVPMSMLIPLNIPILSAVLKKHGIQTELFDTTYYNSGLDNFEKKKEELLQVKPFDFSEKQKSSVDMYSDLYKMVNDYKPNLIAVTLVEDTIDLGLSLLNHIKDFDCPTVVGGVATKFNEDVLLKDPNVDFIVIGEGEKPLLDLCMSIKKNKTCSDAYLGINNVIFTKDQTFSIANNRINKPIDLNLLPFPDYDIFGVDRMTRIMHGKKYKMLQIELDRGCLFDCTYCCAPSIKKFYLKYRYKYYRQKSNDRIIDELKYLKNKYKPDYIDFNSETFLARSESNIKDLMHGYSFDIDLPFWCQGRFEVLTDSKLKSLKYGCVSDMQFGIEHGNENFRKNTLRRHGTNKNILNCVNLLEKHKIKYTLNFITGFPNETRDMFFDSVNLAKEIHNISRQLKTLNCYMMAPYKGTWFRKILEQEKQISVNAKSNQLLNGADIKYENMTKQQFLGLQRTFPLYSRLDESWHDMIYKAENFTEQGNKIFKELREFFISKFY